MGRGAGGGIFRHARTETPGSVRQLPVCIIHEAALKRRGFQPRRCGANENWASAPCGQTRCHLTFPTPHDVSKRLTPAAKAGLVVARVGAASSRALSKP